jgi:hypothetical protein
MLFLEPSLEADIMAMFSDKLYAGGENADFIK